jgi:hypothetical protein
MLVDGHRLGRVTSMSNIGGHIECISHGDHTRFAVLSDAPTRFKPGDGSEWLFSPSFYERETNRNDSRERTVASAHLYAKSLGNTSRSIVLLSRALDLIVSYPVEYVNI